MAFAKISATAKGGADFNPVPAGVHLAICTQVVDMGWQPGSGKYPNPKRQVYIKFEIPDVTVEWVKNGEKMSGPATIGRKFGLSISEKSHLRPFLVGWRGKDFTADEEKEFDITSIIGKLCQLSVVHEKGERDGKVYAKIGGAFALIQLQKDDLKKNPAKAKSSQPLIVYSPEDHDQAMWEALPEWIQKAIDDRVDDPSAVDNLDQTTTGTDKVDGSNQSFDDDLDSIPF
jgi:hypothetical protein